MQPNHFDLIVWDAIVAERQARIKADVQALRAGAELGRRPGAVRRRLGQALIALGRSLTEPVEETHALPARPVQPALSGATQQ
jgi:hypothetical protein